MTYIISDTHIGAVRSAGTTINSALDLRKFLLESLSKSLELAGSNLIILGDLFDTFNIAASDLLETYQILKQWLTKGHKLHLVIGNHDKSKDSGKLSSFEFMSRLLLEHPNVTYLDGGGWIDEAKGIYGISHIVNQDAFNMELEKVPECSLLVVHANFDNNFAVQSDHSLNVSAEQAQAIPAKYIYFAHEHYKRTSLGGKVFIGGNPYPSSVSDCLHDEDKCMYRWTGSGFEAVKTWDKSNYRELDWRNPEPCDAQFIRFVGHAKAEEAAEMADTIARYRKVSDAFVVTNAVKVGEDDEAKQLALNSLEAINKFSVMDALRDYLSDEQMKIVESLNAKKSQAD